MPLKFYNTLVRKKEIFKPMKSGFVGIYSCGPTVYWYQHIGNLRSYIAWDILKRILQFNGFKVNHIVNVTDVGQLTSDADTGEDKMEKAAKKEGKTAKEISEYYFRIFREDLDKVNFIQPDHWPKATDNIPEQIEMIKKLEEKGYTYRTSDGIYFDTSKLSDYGKLANLNVEGLEAGRRIAIGEKRNKTDFALWKFSDLTSSVKRQQEWKSPWGIGYPGWHIECSAMSSKYLGEQFDIHTGGQEHISVHHPNEIAQSEAVFEKKPWVRYWLHSAWLLFKGEKVSKSKGEILRLSDLEGKGYAPLEYRYFCLTTHYRKPLEFSLDKLGAAQNSYRRLKNIISELDNGDDKKLNESYLNEFKEAINDDMNMPEALQVLWKMLRDGNAEGKLKTIEEMDEVFGLDLLKEDKIDIPEEIKELAEKREKARREKDFGKADEFREKINKEGYVIEDTEESYQIKKR